MSTQAIRVPQPLSSDEIREGIAVRISSAIEGLSTEDRKELHDGIWVSLGKTCSLNRQSYAKFSARWRLDYGHPLWASWTVHYELDDFGRVVDGMIGGSLGVRGDGKLTFAEGVIEPVPPDRFRRETNQPIPQPQVVQKKADNQIGVTRSVGRPRKVRET